MYSLNQMKGQYRSGDSPNREAISSELQEHSHRIKQLLRGDLIILQEQNAVLKSKCKKVNELQDQVEMILRQNSQLLSENQRITKLLHQKKSQLEILKDKYEAQLSQKMGFASEYQLQKKKLLKEIEHLQSQLRDVDHFRNTQLNEAKSQYQMELQAIKRQTGSTHEVYEGQLRKIREQLDRKDYELNDTNNRLKRLSSEAEYQVLRLKEEKQKLRSELTYIETDRKNEIQVLRAKLQNNYADEMENMRKSQMMGFQGLQIENDKLRDLVASRGSELEQLSLRLGKQKQHLEENMVYLRKDNDTLRGKLVQLERLYELQKDALKMKLAEVHDAQIQEMRANHQKYIQCLKNEIIKLEQSLINKNNEIEILMKEKTSFKHLFDVQGNRYKQQIESLQQKLKEGVQKQGQTQSNYQQKIQQKNRHFQYLQGLNKDQTQNFESQLKSMKQLLEHQRNQKQMDFMNYREKQQHFKEKIREQEIEKQQIQQKIEKKHEDNQKLAQDLKLQLEQTNVHMQSKIDSLTSKNNIIERQIRTMKDAIQIKQRQIKNSQQRIRVYEEREHKLEKQNEDLRNKIIKKDQKTNQMLNDQKQRLESSFAYTLENLKNDNEISQKIEADRLNELNERYKRKEDELNELMKLYLKMRQQMEELTEQEAKKKTMTLKYPGATADLIATKNLFDVYLKAKVLDLCSDAKQIKEEVQRY